MYLCYVDESGDSGAFLPATPQKSGSEYLILSGLIVPVTNWRQSLDVLKAYRKRIAHQGNLAYDIEFHCSELIDPHKIKAYTQISVSDRWRLIREYAETIGNHGAFSIITTIINKRTSELSPDVYLTDSITKLYLAFDQFLKAKNDHGMVLFDRANEKHTSTHVRKLLGTGASGETKPGIKISWVVEDPVYRQSHDSMFIQAADVMAYCVKEKEFPLTARKKFNADRIYQQHLAKRAFKSTISDEDGIIRL